MNWEWHCIIQLKSDPRSSFVDLLHRVMALMILSATKDLPNPWPLFWTVNAFTICSMAKTIMSHVVHRLILWLQVFVVLSRQHIMTCWRSIARGEFDFKGSKEGIDLLSDFPSLLEHFSLNFHVKLNHQIWIISGPVFAMTEPFEPQRTAPSSLPVVSPNDGSYQVNQLECSMPMGSSSGPWSQTHWRQDMTLTERRSLIPSMAAGNDVSYPASLEWTIIVE